ncbi:hemin uptake protein HemP [Nitrosomonas sp. PY1]|uniref:hemin uptake protein HemP n=1 Tax=Nitrosomonas sp. PY1 TaxID=1803906 RepID=UPI0024445B6F|nr:hemin uptake protein HemP [Nitrosomonas sp. PY1]
MNKIHTSQLNSIDSIFYSKGSTENTQKTLDSEWLFKNGDIVLISHKGEQYSLRCTRNGKLLLNK